MRMTEVHILDSNELAARLTDMLYLVVIMDWVSRAVLAWRLANTLGADFCVEALEGALEQYGKPDFLTRIRQPVHQHRLHRRPRARRRHDQHGW